MITPRTIGSITVLEHDMIYEACQTHKGILLPQITMNIDRIDVPIFRIRDPAYSHLQWLMKAFARSPK